MARRRWEPALVVHSCVCMPGRLWPPYASAVLDAATLCAVHWRPDLESREHILAVASGSSVCPTLAGGQPVRHFLAATLLCCSCSCAAHGSTQHIGGHRVFSMARAMGAGIVALIVPLSQRATFNVIATCTLAPCVIIALISTTCSSYSCTLPSQPFAMAA